VDENIRSAVVTGKKAVALAIAEAFYHAQTLCHETLRELKLR
jgi:hypothetical protein